MANPHMSAAAAKRPSGTYAMRKCHNCKTMQRASQFRELHKQVHMLCAHCYQWARYGCDTDALTKAKAAMRAYKTQAKARGLAFQLAVHEFCGFWRKPCHYCGRAILGVGIDRVDNTRGYSALNCVPCCWPCNSNKNDNELQAWFDGY